MPTLLSPQGNGGCPSFLTHFSIFLISTLCFCGQTTESRVNFVILRQPGVQLGEPVEDGSTSNSSSSSSSNGGSPVHHRRRPDQNHYRRKSSYQKVGLGNEAKVLLILGLVDALCCSVMVFDHRRLISSSISAWAGLGLLVLEDQFVIYRETSF